MTKRNPYNRRTLTQMPTQVETAADRGQVLQAWLDANNYFQDDFAKNCKISLSTLTGYLSGTLDIAKMKQTTAEKLLTEMGVSDTEAWKMFAIPEDKKRSFRTFRPPPMGHGEDVRKLVEIKLTGGLRGDYSAPADSYLRYDPAVRNAGTVVAEMADGVLYALPHLVAAGKGRVLGRFVSISETSVEG